MSPRSFSQGAAVALTRSQMVLCAALFTLMGISIVTLLMVGGSNRSHGNDADRIAEIARTKIDSLRALPYYRLTSGCDTLEANFIRRWYVTTNLTASRKSVELLVSWPLTAGHTVSFNTYVGDSRYKVRP